MVTCEVDFSKQLPGFTLVGLPSSITQESKERVRLAVENAGIEWPHYRITMNLHPAQLPKWGSHMELPMATSILGRICFEDEELEGCRIFSWGELSLSGDISPMGWGKGFREFVLSNSADVLFFHPDDRDRLSESDFEGIECISVKHLREVSDYLWKNKKRLKNYRSSKKNLPEKKESSEIKINAQQLIKEVREEYLAKVAAILTLCNSNMHLIFAGSHGVGKSMLVKVMTEIFKKIKFDNDLLNERESFFKSVGTVDSIRPEAVFLQSTLSRAALEGAVLGNGSVVLGEFSRAHHSMLVADEFLEFHRDVIECFRQPMEEGIVRLQRAKVRTELPAEFQLFATTNLCKCGKLSSYEMTMRCNCTVKDRKDYLKKLSGPILDRFDFLVELGERPFDWSRVDPLCERLMHKILYEENLEDRISELRRIFKFEKTKDAMKIKIREIMKDEKLMRFVPNHYSDRSKEKVARIAILIAMFIGKSVECAEIRLALMLRCDFEKIKRNLI